MKLSILIPQYKETDEIVKPLLDSIAIQQNVDLGNDVEVIICNDGTDVHLSDELINGYPFKIHYYLEEHRGVSATRNACLDHSSGEYVMFCDADDMFCNVCGLYIIMQEINHGGFDSMVSAFLEESRHPQTKEPLYIAHQMDSTFVHGKVHRRSYLINNNIRWNDALQIHEDSYFNCLCQRIASPDRVKYCPTPFYLWKWRDESVCRHDPLYIQKTYTCMLDSNTALVKQFLDRSRKEDAQFYVTSMIMDAYYSMNTDKWTNQENQEYRITTEKRFKEYYHEFKGLFDSIDPMVKNQIAMGIRNRFFQEGLLFETITFEDWIKRIESL